MPAPASWTSHAGCAYASRLSISMSPPLPFNALPEPSIEILNSWLTSNGITYHPALRIERMADSSGWKVVSRASILLGRHVASIPKTSILSIRTTALPGLAELYPLSSTPSVLPLALALLYEMRLGEQSSFFGYLQSLPRALIPLPVFWDVEELGFGEDGKEGTKWLKGTEVAREMARKDASGQSFSAISAFFTDALPLFPATPFSPFPPTLPHFLHAYGLCTSRAFQTDVYHRPALLPFADLFNHSANNHIHLESDDFVCPLCGKLPFCSEHDDSNPPSRLSTIGEEWKAELEAGVDDCVLVVNREIGKGDEVFNTYGEIGIGQALAEYGYADEELESEISWSWNEMPLGRRQVHSDWKALMRPLARVDAVEDLETLIYDKAASEDATRSTGFGISAAGQLSLGALACIDLASSGRHWGVEHFEKMVVDLETCWDNAQSGGGYTRPDSIEEKDEAFDLVHNAIAFLEAKVEATERPKLDENNLLDLREVSGTRTRWAGLTSRGWEGRKDKKLQVMALTACILERGLLETTLGKWKSLE